MNKRSIPPGPYRDCTALMTDEEQIAVATNSMNVRWIDFQASVLFEFARKIDVIATGALESRTFPLDSNSKHLYAILISDEDEIIHVR